jgi:hypothetical protein
MKGLKNLLLPSLLVLAGCLQSGGIDSSRFDPAQRFSPTAFVENATMKDTSVHENPDLLKAGATRDQIAAAFGVPNETNNTTGQIEDEYDFNPDGSKFVKPKIYARNIAAGIFTGGAATVAHQVRIHHAESQLTVYHLTYGPEGRVTSVQKESRDNPDDTTATPANASQPASPPIE